MGDSTHQLTANGISNQDTVQVTVPAEVQREQGIGIDDEVEVTIEGLTGLFNSISITREQKAGDRLTVPAEVARAAGIDHGEQLQVTFEKVASDDAIGIPDEEVTSDEEVEEAIEEAEEQMDEEEDDSPGLGELFSTDDKEDEVEEEEAEEEEGLGELFG